MIRRFKYAASGLREGLKTDRSIRQHLLVAMFVFAAAIFFGLSAVQWAILILTIFFVVAMEFVNSAIEAFADRVHPEEHPGIKKTKDLAAAGVLLAAIAALFVGILLFLPPLVKKTAGCCTGTNTGAHSWYDNR